VEARRGAYDGDAMVTRSVQLSDTEAEELRQLLAETGESEEAVLREATVRGLRDLRLERGIRAFKEGRGSSEGARIAGWPRAVFLQELLDRGVVVLDGPSTLNESLAELGRRLGDERLIEIAGTRSPNER
jgi:hypothetical protein